MLADSFGDGQPLQIGFARHHFFVIRMRANAVPAKIPAKPATSTTRSQEQEPGSCCSCSLTSPCTQVPNRAGQDSASRLCSSASMCSQDQDSQDQVTAHCPCTLCSMCTPRDMCVGGARRFQAGTGHLAGPYTRPLDVLGFGYDGSRHVVRNGHDLAAKMAAHVLLVRNRPPEPQPPVRDVIAGLSDLDQLTIRGEALHPGPPATFLTVGDQSVPTASCQLSVEKLAASSGYTLVCGGASELRVTWAGHQAQPLQRTEQGTHLEFGRGAHQLLLFDQGLHIFHVYGYSSDNERAPELNRELCIELFGAVAALGNRKIFIVGDWNFAPDDFPIDILNGSQGEVHTDWILCSKALLTACGLEEETDKKADHLAIKMEVQLGVPRLYGAKKLRDWRKN
eukprot:6042881-Amphidinium_carterae.1